MGPTDTACPYCEAALAESDRRVSMLCPVCLARIEAHSKHCRACGVPIAPQSLVPIPDGRTCPRCEGALGIRDLGRTSVIDCTQCGGLWLRAADFEELCRRAGRDENVLPSTAPATGEGVRRMEDVKYIPCLTCGQLMNRRQFRHRGSPSRVVIDLCRNHGVWLDHEELQEIVAFVRSGAFRDARPTAAEEWQVTGSIMLPGDFPAPRRTAQSPVTAGLAYLGWLLFGG